MQDTPQGLELGEPFPLILKKWRGYAFLKGKHGIVSVFSLKFINYQIVKILINMIVCIFNHLSNLYEKSISPKAGFM